MFNQFLEKMKAEKYLNSSEIYVDIDPKLIERLILFKLKQNDIRSERKELVNKVLATSLKAIKAVAFFSCVYILIQIINLLIIFQ